MPYLDFFAAHDDQVNVVEFLFSQTDVRVFESYSPCGQELTEFTSVKELNDRYNLGVDHYGNGFGITLQLWSPSAMVEAKIRRISLKPHKCGGHTFRYCIEGGGLIQLYFGGIHGNALTKSHYGHNTQRRAEIWGIDKDVDWKALAKLSNKIQYHIRRRLAVARAHGYSVLRQAYELAGQGCQLKESANSPWQCEIEPPVPKAG